MLTTRRCNQTDRNNNDACVLCVDDDADLTRALKARLQRHKIEVTRASSGRDGLRMARGQRPSAIITDLGMPGGDGEYLIRRLQSRPSTASIPVLILSGLDDPSRVNEAYQLGATLVLQKPIPFEQLLAELKRVLDDHSEPNTASEALPQPRFLRSGKKLLRVDASHNISIPQIRVG